MFLFKLKKIIKLLLNPFLIIVEFLFCITFFFIAIVNFLIPKNYKKIKFAKNIFIFSKGGFGHQVWVSDIVRYLKLKDSLVINLLDLFRHNEYLSYCFDNKFIDLNTTLNFSNKYFNVRFGEKEGGYFYFIHSFLIFVLRNILKKKVICNEEIYKLLYKLHLEKNIHLKYDLNLYRGILDYQNAYYYCLNQKKLKVPNLKEEFRKKFNFLSKFSEKKICTLYLRNRYSNDIASTFRNSGSMEDYELLIKYLENKNYLIVLIGEANQFTENFNQFSQSVIDYKKFKIKKRLFDLYFSLNNDLFICESGGAHNLAYYSKCAIGINFYPYGYRPVNFKNVVYKKFFKDGVKIEKNILERDYINFYDLNKIKKENILIENNNKNEILSSIVNFI